MMYQIKRQSRGRWDGMGSSFREAMQDIPFLALGGGCRFGCYPSMVSDSGSTETRPSSPDTHTTHTRGVLAITGQVARFIAFI